MELSKLDSLVGRTVRIGRVGPESRCGKLLKISSDHLVLYCEDEGVIYYKANHIKSISLDAKDYSNATSVDPNYVAPQYLEVDTFEQVLEGMKNRWVQINRGPDRVEGVLAENYDDRLVLVSKNEVVTIFNFHIKNISYEVKQDKEKKEQQEKGKKDENKNDKK
ncbi:hypothetical protein [Aneurinibacillus terranovensis]|uniref:hypothetical protein n=1 Tax=Aneurinibacillus terranovensis TaxID=278991 RepID=UPI00047F272C|nr:hypothetical protein [Aneurinibacillus terranovensis]